MVQKGFSLFVICISPSANQQRRRRARHCCWFFWPRGKNFLTDLIRIITESGVGLWRCTAPLAPSHKATTSPTATTLNPQRDEIEALYKLAGNKNWRVQASLGVCIFLHVKQTGKLLARQRTDRTSLYHRHSGSFRICQK